MQGFKTSRRSRIWLGLFTVLFLLLSCLTAAYFGYRQHLEESALSVLTDEERAAFREWLQTPITPNAKALEPLPPLHENLAAEKDKFFKVIHETRSSFASKMRETEAVSGYSLQDKIEKWFPLTAHEADMVTNFTRDVRPLVEPATKLANNPLYTLETRDFPGNSNSFLAYNACFEVFYYYACATAKEGNWNEALKALALLSKLLRVEETGGYFGENEAHLWSSAFTSSLSDRTSDTEVLKQILKIGLSARPLVEHATSDKCFDAVTVNNTRHMIADGYINFLPVTRYDHYKLAFTARDYYQWVADAQTTSAPDKSAQAAQLVRDMDSFFPDEPHVERIRKGSTGMPQSIRRPLYFSGNYPKVVEQFKYYVSWKSDTQRDLAKYDLHCLKLVRRISELQGLSKNGPDLKLIQKYMGGVPSDLFGSGQLQYNQERQAYYSVGPDGISGSSDDIYD